MNGRRARALTATIAKGAISAALIALVLRGMDSGAVAEHLGRVEPVPVILAVVITTAIALLHARRWEIVLARMDHELPFGNALKLVLIGYFFNQTLPSTIGGDAYRAYGAYRKGIHGPLAIASVVVDRILAIASLQVMILTSLAWLFDIVPQTGARWIVALALLCGFSGIVLLLSLGRLSTQLQRWRVTRYLLHLSSGMCSVLARPASAAQVIVLTVAGYTAYSFAVYILARGMGVALGFGHAMLLVPLVTLVTVLPVSVAGWGLRESSMVLALGLIGVPSAQAFSLSVLVGLVAMASGVPGGILWLSSRRNQPHAAPS